MRRTIACTRRGIRRGLLEIPALVAMMASAQVPAGAAAISPLADSHLLATPQSPSAASYAGTGRSSSGGSQPPSVKKAKRRRSRFRRVPKQKAPTPDRIKEIQSALARDGYYDGEPNGKWDSRTAQAMERFQQDHGLPPTGKLDALSLQRLGLGSEIAGVSAPQPAEPTDPATGTSKPPRF